MAEIMCPSCGMEKTVHTVLHNFRLEHVLGVGGMSIVLQGRDLVLNRTLAIKVLKDNHRNNPDRVARFEKECALMAKVRHPNVVSVYSAGEAHGQFYIAMELVEGTNLELMVNPQNPMSPLKALSIVRQVAKGLNAANKAGLLHRDIKPGNILVTRKGRAKVLDFGLSLGKSDADTEETIWATPFYVPPETLLREQEDVRTDIYALGMTLRYLLSGCESFPNIPQTPDELLECKRSLPPLRSREFKIDESYADLINHMTAYDINDRSTGYVDLLQEMEEVYQAQRAYEIAQSPLGRAKSRLKRFLFGVCVFLLGGLVAWLTCIICTPAPEHDAITYSEQGFAAQQDAQLLQMAEDALRGDDSVRCVESFMALSRNAKDPALAAWGSLMALQVGDIAGAKEHRAAALASFENHMKLASQASPAGKDAVERMRIIMLAEKDKDASIPANKKQPQDGIYQALLHVSRMKFYAQQNNRIELQIQQEKAVDILALDKSPYGQLAQLLKQKNDVDALLQQLKNLLADTPSASDTKQQTPSEQGPTTAVEVDTPAVSSEVDLSPLARRNKEFEAEIIKVSRAVSEMLKRKFPSEFRDNMSPDEKLELVHKMHNAQLLAEVKTLYHLEAGRIEEAIQSNPYKYTPCSSEPFATLVQRWLLGAAPPTEQPFPHQKIYIYTPTSQQTTYRKNERFLTGGVEAEIVSHSSYGMTLETKDAQGKPRFVDYLRMSGNFYCEMPPAGESGIWVELTDSSGRRPCYLKDSRLVSPVSRQDCEDATVLKVDDETIIVRWNKQGENATYNRNARGVYTRSESNSLKFYSLINQRGEHDILHYKSVPGHAFVYESALSVVPVDVVEISKKKITIKKRDGSMCEVYELADDGMYIYKRSSEPLGETSYVPREQITLADPFEYARCLLLGTYHLLPQASRSGKKLDIVEYHKDAITLSSQDLPSAIKLRDGTQIQSPRGSSPIKYERRADGAYYFAGNSLPNGAKCEVLSIHDPGWSGALTVYTKGKVRKAWRALRAASYDSADVLSYDGKRLEIKWHRWGKAVYVKNSEGLYIAESNLADGKLVARFRMKDGSRRYMGIDKGKMRYWISFSACIVGDVVKCTPNEIQVHWKSGYANEVHTFLWNDENQEYVYQ